MEESVAYIKSKFPPSQNWQLEEDQLLTLAKNANNHPLILAMFCSYMCDCLRYPRELNELYSKYKSNLEKLFSHIVPRVAESAALDKYPIENILLSDLINLCSLAGFRTKIP